MFADIAQSAERVLGKDEVVSSSLIISSRKHSRDRVLFCCVKTAETLMFTGAATKVSVPYIFYRESGAQALRRLSEFEGRIFFHKHISAVKSSDRSTDI